MSLDFTARYVLADLIQRKYGFSAIGAYEMADDILSELDKFSFDVVKEGEKDTEDCRACAYYGTSQSIKDNLDEIGRYLDEFEPNENTVAMWKEIDGAMYKLSSWS